MENADIIVAASYLPALVITLPMAIRGNGSRPLGVLCIIVIAMLGWSIWDGFGSDQTWKDYLRRGVVGVALTACPVWAAWKGRTHGLHHR